MMTCQSVSVLLGGLGRLNRENYCASTIRWRRRMIEQFKKFMENNEQELREIKLKFSANLSNIDRVLSLKGFSVEYNRDNDYLYITIGEPREGMALTFDEVVAIADPDTLEILGLEVPFFMERFVIES
jgi:hypothetical protein